MNKQNSKAIYPILFGFFVMGFADVVGIATNYVKVAVSYTHLTLPTNSRV